MNQQEFFNRYQYDISTDHLGGGGFGTVYKALDIVRDQWVAIKISEVKKGMESLSLLKEVELAAQLPDHVNIAHYKFCYRFTMPNGIYDYGVLQYYPLGNLSMLIQNKALTQTQKEQIAMGIIDGLDYLHRNNIVHRDLKSSNILMAERNGGRYIPKIADFGLSKQFQSNEQSYFSNSFAGGSLLYVAPEQLSGGHIRKNVDIWSLGAVLFELFTGQPPFLAEKEDAHSETGRQEIVKKINTASIPDSINSIPSPWQSVIRKCLVVNPKDRIATMAEIKAILGMKEAPKPSKKIEVIKTPKKEPVVKTPETDEETVILGAVATGQPAKTRFNWLPMLIGFVAVLAFGYVYRYVNKSSSEIIIAEKGIEQTCLPFHGDSVFVYKPLSVKDNKLINMVLSSRVKSYNFKGRNCKVIKNDFKIGSEFIEKYPCLINAIINSRSIDTKEEKQNWFNLFPMMNNEQFAKLIGILEKEARKLNEIEVKYDTEKLADALQEANQFELVAALYEKNGNNVNAGWFYLLSGDYKKSKRNSSIDKGNSAVSQGNYASYYLLTGKLDKAITEYTKLIDKDVYDEEMIANVLDGTFDDLELFYRVKDFKFDREVIPYTYFYIKYLKFLNDPLSVDKEELKADLECVMNHYKQKKNKKLLTLTTELKDKIVD